MKIAIVTGASSGMGREFVTQLSQYVSVDEIWVIARREAALASLQAETKIPVRPISLDLTQEESFRKYEALLEKEKPNVKLLVNAAGFGKFGDFRQISAEEEWKMIDLNCKALTMMTRLTVPYMRRGSHILQLDSISAFQPVPYIATYGATKSFVLSYTRAISRELRKENIRVMAMTPFWVRTEFFNHAFQSSQTQVQNFTCVYEAKDVVATGLKDLYRSKKDYSIHGAYAKFQAFLVHVLPHSIVMRIWLQQQKKPKNNTGLIVDGRK